MPASKLHQAVPVTLKPKRWEKIRKRITHAGTPGKHCHAELRIHHKPHSPGAPIELDLSKAEFGCVGHCTDHNDHCTRSKHKLGEHREVYSCSCGDEDMCGLTVIVHDGVLVGLDCFGDCPGHAEQDDNDCDLHSYQDEADGYTAIYCDCR